ncbi:MAG: FHA domain-containing protein [Candidatus Omnitrophica bacterium]|nr:FHA domain-containing protein [Candidatus Omnitrophota bacterium]
MPDSEFVVVTFCSISEAIDKYWTVIDRAGYVRSKFKRLADGMIDFHEYAFNTRFSIYKNRRIIFRELTSVGKKLKDDAPAGAEKAIEGVSVADLQGKGYISEIFANFARIMQRNYNGMRVIGVPYEEITGKPEYKKDFPVIPHLMKKHFNAERVMSNDSARLQELLGVDTDGLRLLFGIPANTPVYIGLVAARANGSSLGETEPAGANESSNMYFGSTETRNKPKHVAVRVYLHKAPRDARDLAETINRMRLYEGHISAVPSKKNKNKLSLKASFEIKDEHGSLVSMKKSKRIDLRRYVDPKLNYFHLGLLEEDLNRKLSDLENHIRDHSGASLGVSDKLKKATEVFFDEGYWINFDGGKAWDAIVPDFDIAKRDDLNKFRVTVQNPEARKFRSGLKSGYFFVTALYDEATGDSALDLSAVYPSLPRHPMKGGGKYGATCLALAVYMYLVQSGNMGIINELRVNETTKRLCDSLSSIPEFNTSYHDRSGFKVDGMYNLTADIKLLDRAIIDEWIARNEQNKAKHLAAQYKSDNLPFGSPALRSQEQKQLGEGGSLGTAQFRPGVPNRVLWVREKSFQKELEGARAALDEYFKRKIGGTILCGTSSSNRSYLSFIVESVIGGSSYDVIFIAKGLAVSYREEEMEKALEECRFWPPPRRAEENLLKAFCRAKNIPLIYIEPGRRYSPNEFGRKVQIAIMTAAQGRSLGEQDLRIFTKIYSASERVYLELGANGKMHLVVDTNGVSYGTQTAEFSKDKSVIKVGRKAVNDILVVEGTVSGEHLEITRYEDGSFRVEDLDSTNGTYEYGAVKLTTGKPKGSSLGVKWEEAGGNITAPEIDGSRPNDISCLRGDEALDLCALPVGTVVSIGVGVGLRKIVFKVVSRTETAEEEDKYAVLTVNSIENKMFSGPLSNFPKTLKIDAEIEIPSVMPGKTIKVLVDEISYQRPPQSIGALRFAIGKRVRVDFGRRGYAIVSKEGVEFPESGLKFKFANGRCIAGKIEVKLVDDGLLGKAFEISPRRAGRTFEEEGIAKIEEMPSTNGSSGRSLGSNDDDVDYPASRSWLPDKYRQKEGEDRGFLDKMQSTLAVAQSAKLGGTYECTKLDSLLGSAKRAKLSPQARKFAEDLMGKLGVRIGMASPGINQRGQEILPLSSAELKVKIIDFQQRLKWCLFEIKQSVKPHSVSIVDEFARGELARESDISVLLEVAPPVDDAVLNLIDETFEGRGVNYLIREKPKSQQGMELDVDQLRQNREYLYELYRQVYKGVYSGRSLGNSVASGSSSVSRKEEATQSVPESQVTSHETQPFEGSLGEKVTREEISTVVRQVAEVVNRDFPDPPFSEEGIRKVVEKLSTMGLVKGKSFLVVGPAEEDSLPAALSKLGLKVSIIDTDAHSLKKQEEFLREFGLEKDIEVFSGYDKMAGRVFDYISVFAVLHGILTPSHLKHEIKDREKIKENMLQILDHLNPEGGRILVNDYRSKAEKTEARYLDEILSGYCAGKEVHFVPLPDVDVNDFSMYSDLYYVLKERRAGSAFELRGSSLGLEAGNSRELLGNSEKQNRGASLGVKTVDSQQSLGNSEKQNVGKSLGRTIDKTKVERALAAAQECPIAIAMSLDSVKTLSGKQLDELVAAASQGARVVIYGAADGLPDSLRKVLNLPNIRVCRDANLEDVLRDVNGFVRDLKVIHLDKELNLKAVKLRKQIPNVKFGILMGDNGGQIDAFRLLVVYEDDEFFVGRNFKEVNGYYVITSADLCELINQLNEAKWVVAKAA